MQVRSLTRRLRDTWNVRLNSGCQRYAIVAERRLYAECRLLGSFRPKDVERAVERIGPAVAHQRDQPVRPIAEIHRARSQEHAPDGIMPRAPPEGHAAGRPRRYRRRPAPRVDNLDLDSLRRSRLRLRHVLRCSSRRRAPPAEELRRRDLQRPRQRRDIYARLQRRRDGPILESVRPPSPLGHGRTLKPLGANLDELVRTRPAHRRRHRC